jgi:hypothetical protein
MAKSRQAKPQPEGFEARVIAELRELIERTRRLRGELRELLVSPGYREPLRRRIHTESWPRERRRQTERRQTQRHGPERRHTASRDR